MGIITWMSAAVLAAVVMLLQQSPAVQPLDSPQRRTPEHLTIVAGTRVEAVAPGSKLMLQLDITPKPGIHVYAPGAEDYLPISLALDRAPGVNPAALKYPKSTTMVFGGQKIPVYDRPFRLVQEVLLDPSVPPGSLTIAGTVKYQACDDRVCFLPAVAPVSWTITVR